ncbi:amidohydrolase family protein [Actinospica sp. MGRD01-02]|uniref:Amidohydrolase family protein n=1 Tax=Actinospica acidithermotolerans TaxID=2828514 RepID=A0A941IJF7_9ACTN|nr:amidohydrolase family protein [Actinospica acidithermotolerans]MBR7827083.1 amidohydrolase family protein [Actinospica acidithermotolerans]
MRTLITGGSVLSMDPAVGDFASGDVLIENGIITRVAAHIDAPDAEVIDATERIVMPGLIDNHRHTWQTALRGIGADWTFPDYRAAIHATLRPRYRPEDVYLGNLLGRLEALHCGVTTMLDWFHCAEGPEHADAAVAGLRDAPGRSIFCYGANYGHQGSVEAEIRRVHRELDDERGPVTMAFGLRGAEDTSIETVAAELKLAAELGLRTSVHIASDGTARPVDDLRRHGLLEASTTFVHANGIADDELRMLADAGSSISISPDVELKMGFGWPMTGRALAAGLRPTLSVDDTPAAAATSSPPCAPPTLSSEAWTAPYVPATCWNSSPSTRRPPVGWRSAPAASPRARTPISSCCARTTSPCSRPPTQRPASSPQATPASSTRSWSRAARSSATGRCWVSTCRH